ncbi:MAG: NfeD family protein [Bacteroidetes bacterium]|nr:NfeD family protein [Bacteroidota bacterium]
MDIFIIAGLIFLILLGIFLILAEIFFTPGLVVGIIGFLLGSTGMILMYKEYGTAAGNYSLMASFFIIIVAVFLLFRFNTWKKLMLKEKIDGKVNIIAPGSVKPGDRGQTISRLAPVGTAMINGNILDVESRGNFIPDNTEITVTAVSINKIFVSEFNTQP